MKAWWIRVLRHAHPPAASLLLVGLLLLCGGALAALAPWPMKLLLDCILKPVPQEQILYQPWLSALPGAGSTKILIIWLAVAGPAVFLAAKLIQVLQTYVLNGLGSRLTYALGAAVLDRLQELSLVFHSRQRVGDLVRRVVTDCGCARDLVCNVLIPGASSAISLTIMFIIMWGINPRLSLIAIAFAAPLGVLIRLFALPMARRSFEQQELEGELMALAEQTLGAVPIVQSFTREAEQDRQYRKLADKTLRACLRSLWSQLQFKIGTSSVTALGNATILLIGGLGVINGSMTIGDLMVFIAYVASLYAPLETLAYLGTGFASASGGAQRVLDILDNVERITEEPDAHPLIHSDARGLAVRFEQVTFGYRQAEPVLHYIDLEIPAGQVVALVGPTGAGKSTLASLVPRLFDPWSGVVKLAGADLRTLTLMSLRRQIAVVPQEPLLLPLSVSDNIAYGRPGARADEIHQAAEAAGAAEFIDRLPQGYATVLGERGCTLSVGQRQRIAIARALLKDASVIILDEPTSAVDSATEQHVLATTARLMAGRTCLIIAHRLSTIRNADRIIVLDQGRILQDGSPSQLAREQGLYQRLLQLQNCAPISMEMEVRT